MHWRQAVNTIFTKVVLELGYALATAVAWLLGQSFLVTLPPYTCIASDSIDISLTLCKHAVAAWAL